MATDARMPAIELRFFHGAREIAPFLSLNISTVRRWLRLGKLPAWKDPAGRWVLTNLDYYRTLQK